MKMCLKQRTNWLDTSGTTSSESTSAAAAAAAVTPSQAPRQDAIDTTQVGYSSNVPWVRDRMTKKEAEAAQERRQQEQGGSLSSSLSETIGDQQHKAEPEVTNMEVEKKDDV